MVVGIDFDTHALYLCAIPTVRDRHHPEQPRTAVGQLRTSGDLYEAIAAVPSALAFAAQRLGCPTGTPCWVERGTGFSRKADWPLGAIAGAIIATWPRITAGGPCRIITTADWKKAIGAPGNAPKNVANTWATRHWQATYPHTPPPTDHNHLDAYAIATTGATR